LNHQDRRHHKFGNPDYKAQLEREKRESEKEIARLKEAQRIATLEKERLEREKAGNAARERTSGFSASTNRNRASHFQRPGLTPLSLGSPGPGLQDYNGNPSTPFLGAHFATLHDGFRYGLPPQIDKSGLVIAKTEGPDSVERTFVTELSKK